MAAAGDHTPRFLLFLLLLVTACCASAQSPPSSSSSSSSNNNNNPYNNPNFNPSMAIVIVVLICAFFFLGFFSIYIRNCAGDRLDPRSLRGGTANAVRSRRGQRGLDPDILASFPTLVYSEVKSHKLGKSSLECAVCLSEFDDDETLRLLPSCDHVFHSDCIDAWLAAHVTCPVCRCNLADPVPKVEPSEPAPEPEPLQQVVINVEQKDEPEKDEDLENLERFINMKRARSKFPRSHSTGHSLMMVMPGENLERFTLRLPENIRKEIVTTASLQRARSLVAFPGEGSSRRGYRGRSIQLGRSGRWRSGLLRTVSMKVSNWGRRADSEGSLKGDSVKGDASFKGGINFRRGESIKGEESSIGLRFFRRGDSIKVECP